MLTLMALSVARDNDPFDPFNPFSAFASSSLEGLASSTAVSTVLTGNHQNDLLLGP